MTDLHAASERIQREVLAAMYESVSDADRDALGLHLEPIADVAVSVAQRDPSILINRAQGLGSRERVTSDTIERVVACYRHYGIARYFFHVYPSTLPPDGHHWLEARGLERARGWVQFARPDEPAPIVKTDLRVEPVGPEHAEPFSRILSNAFDLSALAKPYVETVLSDDRWSCFMSFAGESPAGVGAVFILDELAYLSFGATDPAFRRRGSQGAIMAARIEAALGAGCRHLFTETGEAVDGEEQVSYRNIMRYGFSPVAVCENWAPRRSEP